MTIISFVAASSNSGKTTLIEKVLIVLRRRGLRVAVIKHASTGFDLDKQGKDSWRFAQAGADSVILSGPGKMALLRKVEGELSVEDLWRLAGNVDVVLSEGFKKSVKNKIEVFRHGASADRPLCMDDSSFLALASDRRFNVSIPQFDINDAEGVAEFIVQKSLAPR